VILNVRLERRQAVTAIVIILGISFATVCESATIDNSDHDQDTKEYTPSIFSEATLSTVLWDWAPWIQSFVLETKNNWALPAKSEKTQVSSYVVVEFSVSKKGVLSERELTKSEGAEPIVAALWECLNAIDVAFPLPDHFPDDSLKVKMRLDYPPRK